MSANSIEFSENSENSGQNVQYFRQMATLFVAFPEYSGHSNKFATSSWFFFLKIPEILTKIHHSFAFNYTNCNTWCFCWYLKLMPIHISTLLALATINANAYKSV